MNTPENSAPVALLMGSHNDWPAIRAVVDTLRRFGVGVDAHVMSAHRTPDALLTYMKGASERGLKVIIAAAGGAAHLAGVAAAHTTLPVIGIPVEGGAMNGLDALLSTVQMPGGIPVATVGVGKGGPVNAALLAAQILALSDAELAIKLKEYKQSLVDSVAQGEASLQQELSANA
ncbi:MAG: 5-(carboxyamino)imidazole ribonucleotide mutase [Kiritimatiellae bacterium]|nr:5-(carboxyamino)imidazole ribonucleotide mutase [Kiritimatiellia bacterium]